MIIVGNVSMNIDFQENEFMPLLHGTLQLIINYIITQPCFIANYAITSFSKPQQNISYLEQTIIYSANYCYYRFSQIEWRYSRPKSLSYTFNFVG